MASELFSEFDGKAAAWLRAQGYCILAPEQVAQVREVVAWAVAVAAALKMPVELTRSQAARALLDDTKEER